MLLEVVVGNARRTELTSDDQPGRTCTDNAHALRFDRCSSHLQLPHCGPSTGTEGVSMRVSWSIDQVKGPGCRIPYINHEICPTGARRTMARVPVGQRRQELVEAAFRVIAASGIQKTTTRAICAEAGVNQGIFHYCFNSKKELFQELIRSVVTGMVETSAEIKPARSDTDTDTATAVRTVFDTAWQHARAHPDRHLVGYELTTMALRDDELSDLAAWQYRQYFEQSVRAMAAVEESAHIRWSIPMPVLGRMVATILDGLVLGWLADRDDDATERALTQFADVVAELAIEG
ncbi:hypothetical protein CH286_20790 [Rhodococcus sp. WWJCD1]|nr:hypothetical protein CH286_20790 [Rhodococcus sp. WWJCD1]